MKKVIDYQLIDYGVEAAQCFQGHSSAFSRYEQSVVGTGDNPKEALEAALEEIADLGDGVDTSVISEGEQEFLAFDTPSVDEFGDDEEHDLHYYVAINFTTEDGEEEEVET